ncbi:hypothetical protein [Paractinoplanes hotanensis]|uniref:Uncharacterized protein n=1 Tax=Paractinoplanes hotanensis TaxID=2906497 RepID=A0ABT0Y836_9ACTN|nr:hypothetical protein [Actinoplanes hotanensis]MCM4082196.1 hypothetical protein [Actinoplanes hotanensis]
MIQIIHQLPGRSTRVATGRRPTEATGTALYFAAEELRMNLTHSGTPDALQPAKWQGRIGNRDVRTTTRTARTARRPQSYPQARKVAHDRPAAAVKVSS